MNSHEGQLCFHFLLVKEEVGRNSEDKITPIFHSQFSILSCIFQTKLIFQRKFPRASRLLFDQMFTEKFFFMKQVYLHLFIV